MLNPTESQPNPPAKATRSQGRVKTVDVHPGRPLHRMEYHLGAEVDEDARDETAVCLVDVPGEAQSREMPLATIRHHLKRADLKVAEEGWVEGRRETTARYRVTLTGFNETMGKEVINYLEHGHYKGDDKNKDEYRQSFDQDINLFFAGLFWPDWELFRQAKQSYVDNLDSLGSGEKLSSIDLGTNERYKDLLLSLDNVFWQKIDPTGEDCQEALLDAFRKQVLLIIERKFLEPSQAREKLQRPLKPFGDTVPKFTAALDSYLDAQGYFGLAWVGDRQSPKSSDSCEELGSDFSGLYLDHE